MNTRNRNRTSLGILLCLVCLLQLTCLARGIDGLDLLMASPAGNQFQWEVVKMYGVQPQEMLRAALEERQKRADEFIKKTLSSEIRKKIGYQAPASPISEEACTIDLTILAIDQFLLHRTSKVEGKPFNDETWQAGGGGICYATSVPNRMINIASLARDNPLGTIGGLPLSYIKGNLSSKSFDRVTDVEKISKSWLGGTVKMPALMLKHKTSESLKIFIWFDEHTGLPSEVRKVLNGNITYVWRILSPEFVSNTWPREVEQIFYDPTGEAVLTSEKWTLKSVKIAEIKKIQEIPPLPSGYRLRDTQTVPPTIILTDQLRKLSK